VNITEANAANVVLRRLIEHERRQAPHNMPDVVEAAAELAERSYKALSAGLTGDEVRRQLAGARRRGA
jgi:hypothetical protein